MLLPLQVPHPLEPTAPPTVPDPIQEPYNGPLPHIYPNLYSPGAPLHDPRVHGKKQPYILKPDSDPHLPSMLKTL